MTVTEATSHDLAVVSRQLGRPARSIIAIGARCRCGNPTVVLTEPRLADGTPFPTFYYLTHPAATAAVSVLEATHVMAEFNALLAEDPEIAAEYARAHERYLSARSAYGSPAEIENVSAGGMPTRVKCLHALVAQTLVVGPGVNPIGDRALNRCRWTPEVCECEAYDV